METRLMSDIVTDELLEGAVYINGFPGFLEDYKVLHCLLKIYQPKSVFEIGTSVGDGTNLITNCLPDAVVYSLDLPFGQGDKPLYQNGKDHVGINCKRPFTQLRGDSTEFDYSRFPCECYFCDATHEEENVFIETCGMLQQNPKLIVWHDVDIMGVYNGIIRAFKHEKKETFYYIYRVTNTRIAYAKLIEL